MSANYQYKKAPNQTELSVWTGLGATPLDLATLAKDVPCQAACPAHTDVPAYIRALSLGRPDQAYRINLEDNVFPAVLGRTCSRPCEDACRHNWTNTQGPVSICHLKRSGADLGAADAKPLSPWFSPTGKKVAVIGGGPAGLAAARELVRYGHQVTLFERGQHLGGMMVDGIPRFRLPLAEVDREIALIVDSGVDVRLGQNVDATYLARLSDEFDAVLVATGTVKAKGLDLPGLAGLPRASGTTVGPLVDGLAFMKSYNDGLINKLEGDVVVVGGGFTAVDCARACARAARRLLGSGHRVTIAYRRGEGQMSADLAELEELRAEGIEVRSLLAPVDAVPDAAGSGLAAVRFEPTAWYGMPPPAPRPSRVSRPFPTAPSRSRAATSL
jgi:formate dehydrogenase major subunit